MRPEGQREAGYGEGLGKGVQGREDSLCRGFGVGMSWVQTTGSWTKLTSFWSLVSIHSPVLLFSRGSPPPKGKKGPLPLHRPGILGLQVAMENPPQEERRSSRERW